MARRTVTLFIPTLNEAEGMKQIMPRIKPEWVDQILVADGQSTDGTVEVAKSFGCDVIVQSKKGIRHAYIEAFPRIRGELVITFSPDGNCIPEAIPELIAKLNEGYDMVVASRYAKGATSEDDDAMTGFGNWLFTTTINKLHGGHYTDAMGIYRGYRTQLFYELGLDREDAYVPERWAFTVVGIEPLLSVRAAKAKARVTEIGANEPKRLAGIRKLQVVRWGAAYMMQIFRELFFWKDSLDELRRSLRTEPASASSGGIKPPTTLREAEPVADSSL
jgi:glycosyltransferase involved in cell wall biosynthesis